MKENVSHKVLVIEDHPEMQAILKRFLAEKAYEVITADNAEVGLEIYNKIQPDIILMDIMLPGMSGLEATKLIRKKHGENRYTPIIMLTAKNKTDEI
ncbi:MAG: response regulator, partial [Calditrichaceae bacterium]